MRGCNNDDLVGIRLSTWDGRLLQDHTSLGAQVSTFDTLFKIVFMKQYDLDHNDMAMVMEFANLAHGTSKITVTMPQYGNQFVVRPVWGSGTRHNHILGLLYQSMLIEQHCHFKGMGVDPTGVDYALPVVQFEL